MKFFNYMLVTLLVLFLSFGGAIGAYFFSNLIMITEVNQSIDTSCWSAFSSCDLNWLASRKDISVSEYRTIQLDKTAAINKATQYLKDNLNLDSNWYPHDGPAIDHTKPVVLQKLEVVNGSEVPTVLNGRTLTETTIHVVLDVPTRFFKDKYYYRFDRYVDLSDFITGSQIN